MAFKLRPAADQDLEDIYNYSVSEWGEDRADRYIRDLETTFQKLDSGELHARKADEINPGLKAYRVASHVVFFRPESYGILIIRVLHRRMDYEQNLGENIS